MLWFTNKYGQLPLTNALYLENTKDIFMSMGGGDFVWNGAGVSLNNIYGNASLWLQPDHNTGDTFTLKQISPAGDINPCWNNKCFLHKEWYPKWHSGLLFIRTTFKNSRPIPPWI